jgi:hypothetical protein
MILEVRDVALAKGLELATHLRRTTTHGKPTLCHCEAGKASRSNLTIGEIATSSFRSRKDSSR